MDQAQAKKLIEDFRVAVVWNARAYDRWIKTRPGSEAAKLADRLVHTASREMFRLEDQLLSALMEQER